MGTTFSAFAYSFSAVAPSGQTLYYNITGGNAQVTSPDSYPFGWTYYTKPEGELIIPYCSGILFVADYVFQSIVYCWFATK